MTMKLVPLAAAAVLIGGSAGADPFVDAVVKNFRDMGYQFVEIERGATQLKAEGVRGSEELEVVYDLATGRILKQERGRADAEYIGRTGIEFDTSSRDFLGDDDRDDDRDDDDDGRDDDDDDRGSDRDDDDDDHDSDRSGSDDDDDDRDSDRSGSDDNGGDRSGSDDRDDDDDDHGGDDNDNDDNDDSDDSDDNDDNDDSDDSDDRDDD